MTNMFVREVTMGAGSSYTENGAISYGSFGTSLMNQFGKAGVYRGRPMGDVFAEQSALWAEDAESALRFPFYLRMITRKDKAMGGNETETIQRGQGNRDESFKRLIWIALYHPEVFYKNLWVLPIVGSWKDLWVMLTMCDGLNKEEFFKVMAEGINDDYHRELVKKYMPRIRSNSKCKTEWAKKTNELAKEFAAFAGWTPKEYRLFKSTGKAHEFQRYICSGLYSRLNFNAIPGKALLNLVSGKFLDNHHLTNKYLEWLAKQPVAKFNGYPFELGRKIKGQFMLKPSVKMTVDKQFDNLIATAKSDNGGIKGNVWCALDTSGSMTWDGLDKSGTTAYDVCVSLGIYFSTLNEGAFHKNVIMFDNVSRVLQLRGSFTDMYQQIPRNAMGGTNFQSVIDEIVRIRKKSPNVPLEDYPTTLLVVSDMQFNPVGGNERTNYEAAMFKLREVFPQEWCENFKMVWWFCSNRWTSDFPSNMDCGGTYVVSGYDGSVISFILGGDEVNPDTGEKVTPSMEEVVTKALTQEALNFLSL
jgi:hypothetical protein